jgi:hypothetical protein
MATREQKACEACGFGGSVTVETRGGKTLCEVCRERRERIATALLAGICANPEAGSPTSTSGGFDARIAVAYADDLMIVLDERPGPAVPLTIGDPEAPPLTDEHCPQACAERDCTETCAHDAAHVGTQHLCQDHLVRS